jgi:2-polyprenyl-3-methyl-5-hydroxy-6-metoxy-1,4-benzoquinol methylase
LQNYKVFLTEYPLSTMVFKILREEYPPFLKTEFYINKNFDENYFFEFEKFIEFYIRDARCDKTVFDLLFLKIKGFIRYSHEFSVLQMRLNQNLNYKFNSFKEVEEKVYNNPMMNDYYLDGLAFSQYLWPNHYMMNKFLINGIKQLGVVARAIDVPCGPGVQSWLARRHSTIQSMTLCDLSLYSVSYARTLHSYFCEAGDWDMFHSPVEKCMGKFDLIINGELMEHLEDPEAMLATLDRLLAKDGTIYLTTAIFAAAIDHIYMFRSAQEVREMLEKRFKIESELVLPVSLQSHREDMYNQPINYACFLRRK